MRIDPLASSAATGASPLTVARSVARFTLAERTPGTAFSARSTRPTHEAQLISSTCSTTVLSGTS